MTVRSWFGQVLLRAPEPLRRLRNAPVIGEIIHRCSYRLIPSHEKVWTQVESGPAEGIWLRLNPRTGQSYRSGEGEMATQKILAKRLRPGMIFYDLGANIGFFSLLGARLVGEEGKVFSFEPDATSAMRLRQNAEKNRFRNIAVQEAGVWSSSGMIHFAVADSASPDHGTGRFIPGGGAQLTRCVSVDDFACTAQPPDAVKCDVEGAEVEVLRGARHVRAARKPWILCETHSPEADRDSRAILNELDYRIETVDALHFFAEPRVRKEV